MTNTLISLAGIVAVVMFLVAISDNRKKINTKQIGIGLLIQIALAFFLIKFPLGIWIIEKLSEVVTTVLGYANEGIAFVFGDLAGQGVFMIDVLMVIIFLASVISILNYLGVIPFIIKVVGGLVAKVMGTEKAESFVAVGNIFMGQTESPFLVAKQLPHMTKSEMQVVLVGGMGSVAGSVLVGYNLLGIPMEYLLLGSALVPIGALTVSKIITPETEESQIKDVAINAKGDNTSVFSAMIEGITNGVALVLSVMGSLIAGISIIALLNGIIGFTGLTIEGILSYIFMPVGLLMGLPVDEALITGQMLGIKMSVNEFVAFSQLSPMIEGMSERGFMLTSISLVGFASFSSIAICIAGLTALAPSVKNRVSEIAFRGMIGGFTVSILSALIVGLFV